MLQSCSWLLYVLVLRQYTKRRNPSSVSISTVAFSFCINSSVRISYCRVIIRYSLQHRERRKASSDVAFSVIVFRTYPFDIAICTYPSIIRAR